MYVGCGYVYDIFIFFVSYSYQLFFNNFLLFIYKELSQHASFLKRMKNIFIICKILFNFNATILWLFCSLNNTFQLKSKRSFLMNGKYRHTGFIKTLAIKKRSLIYEFKKKISKQYFTSELLHCLNYMYQYKKNMHI